MNTEITQLKEQVRELKGKLDIIVREGSGEPPDSLAADYGGTNWELSDEVQAVRKQRAKSKDEIKQLKKVCAVALPVLDAVKKYEYTLEHFGKGKCECDYSEGVGQCFNCALDDAAKGILKAVGIKREGTQS